jgi:hypothetical protein
VNREVVSAAGGAPRPDPSVCGPDRVANPANAFGDRRGAVAALRSIPFLIVADLQHTMTTELADLVLPVSSFVESDDVVPSWGHAYLARQRAAISPVGEARDDLAIYQALAQRLGFGSEMAGDAETWCRRMLTPVLGGAGGWDALEWDSCREPAHETSVADGGCRRVGGSSSSPPINGAGRRPAREHPPTPSTPKPRTPRQILPRSGGPTCGSACPAALARQPAPGPPGGCAVAWAIPAVAVADALEESRSRDEAGGRQQRE